ncbi:hypothetical protein GCM10007967_18130 [Xylanimonas ulmi]
MLLAACPLVLPRATDTRDDARPRRTPVQSALWTVVWTGVWTTPCYCAQPVDNTVHNWGQRLCTRRRGPLTSADIPLSLWRKRR